MDKNTDIRDIRRLVEKFYQGETSPAEEGILAEYFNKTDSHDIPEDLAQDTEVFRSLNSLLLGADEIKIPENLESQLAEITNVVPEKEGNRKFRIAPFIFKAASIVAAACLIWGLLTFIPKTNNLNDNLQINNNQENLTAEVIDIPDNPKSVEETTAKEENKTDKKLSVKQITHRRIAQNEPNVPSQTSTVTSDFVAGSQEDGFIEITDPEEARQIMENIGNLLAANFNESDKAMNTVSASIESYKEITKTILQ